MSALSSCYRISPAVAADFLPIAALDREVWRNTPCGELIPDGEHAWRIWCEHALVYVARTNEGEVAGAILAFPGMQGMLCVHKVMVAKAHRGQGVGSLLFSALLEEIDRRGCSCFLTVSPENHAALQSVLRTPICLDESINSVERTAQAIRLQACRWMNIKPGRVGGLTVALQIRALCETSGIGCWVGGMLESALGAMHCAALATLPNFTYPADLFPSSRFYAEDLSEPEIAFSRPWEIQLPEQPGVGARPRAELLKSWCVAEAVLR